MPSVSLVTRFDRFTASFDHWHVCTVRADMPFKLEPGGTDWEGWARFQLIDDTWQLECGEFFSFTAERGRTTMPLESNAVVIAAILEALPALYTDDIRHELGTLEQERIQYEIDVRNQEILALQSRLAKLQEDYWKVVHGLYGSAKIKE